MDVHNEAHLKVINELLALQLGETKSVRSEERLGLVDELVRRDHVLVEFAVCLALVKVHRGKQAAHTALAKVLRTSEHGFEQCRRVPWRRMLQIDLGHLLEVLHLDFALHLQELLVANEVSQEHTIAAASLRD